MSWIRIVPYGEADGRLKVLYDLIKGPDDQVDNILSAHSLRPHTMDGHMHLYKSVLHHRGNQLPTWLLEVLGVYVSMLNGCAYCVDHHLAGLRRLLADDARVDAISAALAAGEPGRAFEGRELAMMEYAAALTSSPGEMTEAAVDGLRMAGVDDGEILEVNQVVSYFAYANRTVLGLGVTTDGDVLGLSPSDSDDPASWGHR